MGNQTISTKVRLAEIFYNIEETKKKHNQAVEFDGKTCGFPRLTLNVGHSVKVM